jgi:hypothetical protein
MPWASVSDSQQANGRHVAFAKGCGYGRMELVALQAQFLRIMTGLVQGKYLSQRCGKRGNRC